MRRAAAGAFLLEFVFLSVQASGQVRDAQAAVRMATSSVERDSAAAVVAQWTQVLKANPNDRIAALGLATVARLTRDYDEADRRYAELLSPGRPADEVALYATLGEAEEAVGRGMLGRCDSLFTLTATDARALGDSAVLVRALLFDASVRAVSDRSAGVALLRGVDRLIPAGDSGELALYECTRVSVHAIVDEAQIRSVTRDGAALARRAGDRQTEGTCRFQLADALIRTADFAAAVPVLDTLEHLLPSFDRLHRAIVRQTRAFAEEEIGSYGAAAVSARMAIADGEASHNASATAFAEMTLSRMYLELGDVTAAAAYAARASTQFGQLDNRGAQMTATALRAQIARDAGDTAGARALWQQTLNLARRVGDPGYIQETAEGLADIETREGRWNPAGKWLDTMRETSQQAHLRNWERDWWYDEGTLALRAGRLRDAERDLQNSLFAAGNREHDKRFMVSARLAEIHLALGDTVRAERELHVASDELEHWRSTLTEQELRVLAFQRQAIFGGPDPSVARVIAGLAKAGRVEAAFELAERRRARELRDRLERSTALRGDASLGTPIDTAARPTDEPALARVQQALPNDSTLFLEYVTGPGGAPTTLFALTRRDQRAFVLLPADSLVTAIRRFIALVEDGASLSAEAEALGWAVLGPALAGQGSHISHLLVVTDGPLQRLPFAALRLPGRGFVIEHYAVALVPSGLAAEQLFRRPPAPVSGSIIAFGDPHFPLEVSAPVAAEGELFRAAFSETGGLPRLQGSAVEARAVARFGTRSVVRLRDSASAAYFKSGPIDSFAVVHLATHAIVDNRTITRTALALAGGNGQSGFVTPADLAERPLRADLVVLSACRAAGGVLVAGEGVQGLTAPILAAGARAVVASQWEIADRATVRFMHDFYDALAAGSPVDEALRRAGVRVMHARGSPRQWAAFTVTGDPAVREPLVAPRLEWLWRALGR
jgi:CHAT domain-containing protein/tetratricopeptide (TPR) repeat protein